MKKNIKINKGGENENSETILFCKNKILIFKNMITNTILFVQKYKTMDIITASEMNTCIQNLEFLYKELNILDSNLAYLNNKKKTLMRLLIIYKK